MEETEINTENGKNNGQVKCPKCGATDISTNINTGKLRCNFCRHEFEPEKLEGLEKDISKLSGTTTTTGTKNISQEASNMITLKCSSCGAEVVIDTSNQMTARCHWCRNTLSVNEQVPNGAVPDVVLPFAIKKEVAQEEIKRFVGRRKFYANPKFRKEFTTDNIMGVYFPYMLVDVNAHASFSGEGEILKRQYTVGSDENRRTLYDADRYHVERDFDITIEGLSIESNSDRLDTTSKDKTNNIINSIMPFDTENCVKYEANYLTGYTSEKRDVNVDDLKTLAETQAGDIARFAANDSLTEYNRGVAWHQDTTTVKGSQWQSAYLPVWLYSYQEVKKKKKILHYVAVNARTKETMGSVPIHMPKLWLITILIEILAFVAMYFVDWDYDYVFLLTGAVYFAVIYGKYRNSGARHTYETETKRNVTNLKKVDNFISTEKGLSNSKIIGANNKSIKGSAVKENLTTGSKFGDTILNKSGVGDQINALKDVINKTSKK